MPPPLLPLAPSDLPALYQAADRASGQAQRRYLLLFGIDLLALILGAFLSAVDGPPWVAVLGAVSLAVGLVVTAVLSQKSFRQRWYSGRAAAESVKTRSWRYMMRAEPFQGETDGNGRAVDEQFLADLRHLVKDSHLPGIALDPALAEHPHITDRMRTIRSRSLDERRSIYLRDRIGDQKRWYLGKAKHNDRRGFLFFATAMGLQLLAFAAACALIADVGFPFEPVGVLATAATALLTWTQVRRHEELAQSYEVAALDLSLIEEQAPHQDTEAEFSVFVADAESAVSREHTFWLARRDTPLPA